MNRGVIIGWGSKFVIIALTVFNTRLLIEIIGIDGLAAYSIIISLTAWVTLLNLGLPFAAQSLISKYRAEGKDFKSIKSTSVSLALVIPIALIPLMTVIGILVKSLLLVQYGFIATQSVVIALELILLAGITQILTQILFAEHQKVWPNVLPAINSILVFLALIFLKKNSGSANFNLTLVLSLLPNALIYLLSIFLLKTKPVVFVKVQCLLEILKTAKGYALFGFLSAATLSVDYIIMSQALNPEDIVKYNLTSKIFGIVLSIHSVILANSWSQMADLLHTKKFALARSKLRRIITAGFSGGAVAVAGLIIIMPILLKWLASGQDMEVSLSFLIAWALYMAIRIWCDTFAMTLMSYNRMSIVNSYIPFQAFSSVLGQLFFTYMFGLTGVLIGIIFSYLVTAAWMLPKRFYEELSFEEAA